MFLFALLTGCLYEPVPPQLEVKAENFEVHVDVVTMSLSEFVVPDPKSMDQYSEEMLTYCQNPDKGIPIGVQVNYLVIEILPDRLNISGKPVLELSNYIIDDSDFDGRVIPKVQLALNELIDDSRFISDVVGSSCSVAEQVLVVAGKELPFSTFRAIQYNVGHAEVSQLFFLTEPLGDNPSSVSNGKLGLSPLWVREELTLPIHSPS
ncbi:MAG: hypothetical protein CMK59_02495 [Proteobacteria bacterium]|nr:hypothetical protein [Pseudomonadota bacterium]